MKKLIELTKTELVQALASYHGLLISGTVNYVV